MQMHIRRLTCLAGLVGILTLANLSQTTSAQIKIAKCCTEVSITNITAPIIGYRIQRKNPPCVRAVIFQTTEGDVCSHFKQPWVFETIKELEQARRAKKNNPATTTSSP